MTKNRKLTLTVEITDTEASYWLWDAHMKGPINGIRVLSMSNLYGQDDPEQKIEKTFYIVEPNETIENALSRSWDKGLATLEKAVFEGNYYTAFVVCDSEGSVLHQKNAITVPFGDTFIVEKQTKTNPMITCPELISWLKHDEEKAFKTSPITMSILNVSLNDLGRSGMLMGLQDEALRTARKMIGKDLTEKLDPTVVVRSSKDESQVVLAVYPYNHPTTLSKEDQKLYFDNLKNRK